MTEIKIKPSEKVKAITEFVIQIELFDQKNPGFIKHMNYLFKNLPKCTRVTPFHRIEITDDRIHNFIKKTSKAILSRLYMAEWCFVKVISYEHFFVEHIKMVDSSYDTIYNIL
jgi:hypothetical protein